MEPVTAIGMMSGTSLDGVDIALCKFYGDTDFPDHKIEAAETIPYSASWKNKLATAHTLGSKQLNHFDFTYGKYLGELAGQFISKHYVEPDFIASHGHTVFHRPEAGYTLQIGNGAALAAATGRKVITDFRSQDVALGGQGAPLVPVGDRMLFGKFAVCLNLGGFSNVSFEQEGRRIAFDTCPANIALNYFASKMGLDYDADGRGATSGKLSEGLLSELNNLVYYSEAPPKSLGREWFESDFLPIVNKYNIPVTDVLNTITEHIAEQIGASLSMLPPGNILATGGGALNGYLVSRIRAHTGHTVVIPDAKLIHYKEALVFALLGWLRLQGRNNCLASVTGASRDSCSGAVYEG